MGTVAALLAQDGPSEPSGEWSFRELVQHSGLLEETVGAALGRLLDSGRLGCRYVGGVSENLYSLLPEEPVHLPAFVAEMNGGSRSEARRIIATGGLKVNDQTHRDFDFTGNIKTITVGRRTFHVQEAR